MFAVCSQDIGDLPGAFGEGGEDHRPGLAQAAGGDSCDILRVPRDPNPRGAPSRHHRSHRGRPQGLPLPLRLVGPLLQYK